MEGVESPCWILLGAAVEHALEGLEVTETFVSGDVSGPCAGLVVALFVGTGWLI